MPDLGQILQALFNEYATLLRSRDSFVAACFVLWYDFSLTIGREVQYFWSNIPKWGLVEYMFIANRYVPLAISTMNLVGSVKPTISLGFCTFWIGYWSTIGANVQVFLIQLVLCYRLYVIYHRDKRLLGAIMVLLFLTTTASAVIVGIVISGGTGIVSNIPGITYCYATSTQAAILWAYFIPDLAFELCAFACALWKTYRHMEEIKSSRGEYEDGVTKSFGQRLIEAMFRDSLLYFVCMFLLFLGNALLIRFQPDGSGLGQILQGPTLSVASMLCTHMLLHSRESVEEIYHPEAKMSTLQTINFASGERPTNSTGTTSGLEGEVSQ